MIVIQGNVEHWFQKVYITRNTKKEKDLPWPEVSHATKPVSLIEPYACNSYLFLRIIVYPYLFPGYADNKYKREIRPYDYSKDQK